MQCTVERRECYSFMQFSSSLLKRLLNFNLNLQHLHPPHTQVNPHMYSPFPLHMPGAQFLVVCPRPQCQCLSLG